MRGRHLPHRRAADGGRDPQGHRRERLRPARFRAVRVRRRGARARGRICQGVGGQKGHRSAAQGGFDLVRVRRRGGRRAPPLRAQRDHGHAGAGEALERPPGRAAEESARADGRGRHRRRAPALRVLARRAPQGADQRSRDSTALGAPAERLRSGAEEAFRRALRKALRPRLRPSRRAARDRRVPPARARAHAAPEAREGAHEHEENSGAREAEAPLDLLARPRQGPRDAGLRRREARSRQPDQGPGDRRDRGHDRRGPPEPRAARRRARQLRNHVLGREAMDTCTVETGLLKKKPCGETAVSKCGNCEQPLCGKHAVGRMSAGKKIFLCPDCAKAWKEQEKVMGEPSAPHAAPKPAPAAKPAACGAAAGSTQRGEAGRSRRSSGVQTDQEISLNAPLKKRSELTGVAFDGKRSGYVPPRVLKIASKLRLHQKAQKDIDPVTFEVVRHALWNVNEEHGATIQRLSGSPVAMYALDLNPSILTEDAEFVYFGPYMQYMSGVTDTQVKWTLENRSDNPGIAGGDMFLANDPWVGAAHQMDVMLLCPVFWQGTLFCWVTNCLHQYDIGGITPGSFCPSARDAFDEGILLPPVKIVERNEIRRDIEDVYLRSSRKPSAVALDFRAQLAGNTTARDRILALIARYGAETVKGVMRKIIDDGERAFLKKLASLPDGIWRDRTYVECCAPGDRQVHRVALTLRKLGQKLVFENEGTDPQAGGINATYSGWRGAIMVALNELMCWEQYYAVGGALRHVEFNPRSE